MRRMFEGVPQDRLVEIMRRRGFAVAHNPRHGSLIDADVVGDPLLRPDLGVRRPTLESDPRTGCNRLEGLTTAIKPVIGAADMSLPEPRRHTRQPHACPPWCNEHLLPELVGPNDPPIHNRTIGHVSIGLGRDGQAAVGIHTALVNVDEMRPAVARQLVSEILEAVTVIETTQP